MAEDPHLADSSKRGRPGRFVLPDPKYDDIAEWPKRSGGERRIHRIATPA
jgi:hypothetical protein